MNRQLHRIVFNRSRGQLMAVQETASSVSGGCGGETRATCASSPLSTTLNTVRWAALLALSLAA